MNSYEKKIIYTLEKYAPSFFKDPNVISIGLGHKIIDGYMLNIPTLSITVKEKVNSMNINPYNKIPKEIDGILTDIIEAKGTLRNSKLQKSATEPTELTLPAYGGGSIRNAGGNNNNIGSLAHIVLLDDEANKQKSVCILSTLDVLTRDETMERFFDKEKNLVDSIIYPGSSKFLNNFIPPAPKRRGQPVEIAYGLLPKSLKPAKSAADVKTNNLTNAALSFVGNLDDPSTFKKVTSGVEPDRRTLKKTKPITLGDKVFKFSAASGQTWGTVQVTSTLTLLKIYSKIYYFRDQIQVNIPYAPEDRGTLGLIKSNATFNKADSTFGMCIGGYPDKNLAFFTPIEKITTLFKISLLFDPPTPKSLLY